MIDFKEALFLRLCQRRVHQHARSKKEQLHFARAKESNLLCSCKMWVINYARVQESTLLCSCWERALYFIRFQENTSLYLCQGKHFTTLEPKGRNFAILMQIESNFATPVPMKSTSLCSCWNRTLYCTSGQVHFISPMTLLVPSRALLRSCQRWVLCYTHAIWKLFAMLVPRRAHWWAQAKGAFSSY